MLPVNRRLHSFRIQVTRTPPDGQHGFTLVELLVVTVMILILFSVSLPSLLEAQVRDKVAKAKGDIRLISFAMEEYFRDYRVYPAESESDASHRSRAGRGLFWLTSPVTYLESVPKDPFGQELSILTKAPYFYETGGIRIPPTQYLKFDGCLATWALFSIGPDERENQVVSAFPHYGTYDGSVDSYSPTNGTTSEGDIFQYGGDPFWIGVASAMAIKQNYRSTMDVGLVVDHKTYLHRLPPGLR